MSDVTNTAVPTPKGWPGDCVARLAAVLRDGLPSDQQIDVPIIAPAMLLAHPAIAAHLTALQAPVGTSAVHVSQKFSVAPNRDISQAGTLTIAAQKTKQSAHVAVCLRSEQTWVGEVETRVQFVDSADVASVRGPKVQERMLSGAAPHLTSAPLDRELVARYVALSGDTNPIHVSQTAAHAAGFVAAVVPGMLICGLAETAAFASFPELSLCEMSTRFLSAVSVGHRVRFVTTPRAGPRGGLDDGLPKEARKSLRVFALTEDDTIVAISDLRGPARGAML